MMDRASQLMTAAGASGVKKTKLIDAIAFVDRDVPNVQSTQANTVIANVGA